MVDSQVSSGGGGVEGKIRRVWILGEDCVSIGILLPNKKVPKGVEVFKNSTLKQLFVIKIIYNFVYSRTHDKGISMFVF